MAFDLRQFAAKVRVTDGAWGTEMQKKGLPPGGCPELWNKLNPASVEVIARSYVQAGSEVILTNTFGANRFVLAGAGAAERVAELAEAGVAISRKAVEGTDVKVFASLGPTGKIVMTEEVPREKLYAAFVESAEALAWGGADAIVLESFNELDEARIALQAVRKAASLPVVVCMTFSSGPDKTATMMGNKPSELAKMAQGEGADAVGANCGVGPDNYVRVAALLRSACTLPVWVKANAGVPALVRGKTTFPMGPAEFASFVPKLAEAGANFIGGCCGTSPEHIAAVRQAVDALRR